MAESFEAKLTLNAAEFVRGLQDAQKQGLNLDKALDDVTASAKASAVGVADIGKASATIKTGGLDGLISKFKEGQQQSAQGGGLFGDIATKLGNLVSPAGAATAAIGALTVGLKASIDIGKEFEQNLAGVSAVTGVSGAALDDLGNRARELAVQFGGTASTQLKSFQGILSKFGADLAGAPEALGKVSENVNILAKAGGLDAAQAMDALANSMLQFGVNVSDSEEAARESGRFINVLAASAKVGAAEIPQVADAILVAGVAAKQAKVSFEETNAAIQVLAAGGKVGAEAGTALRNVLVKIAGEDIIPKEALSKLVGLGVNMKVVSDTTLPLSERLKELSKASKDATAFAQVFGTENAAAASILASGADKIRAWTAEITNTGEAQRQAATNMNTFSERMSRLTAYVQDFGITAFQNLMSLFNGLIDVGAALGNAIDGLINPTNAAAEAAKKHAEAERDITEASIEANNEHKATLENAKRLVDRFEELATKKKRTKEETAELKRIQAELDRQYPSLIDQTKDFSDNLDGVRRIGEQTALAIAGIVTSNQKLTAQLAEQRQAVLFAEADQALQAARSFATLDALTKAVGVSKGTYGEIKVLLHGISETFAKELFAASTTTQIEEALVRFNESFNPLAKERGLFTDKRTQEYVKNIQEAARKRKEALAFFEQKPAEPVVVVGGGGGGGGDTDTDAGSVKSKIKSGEDEIVKARNETLKLRAELNRSALKNELENLIQAAKDKASAEIRQVEETIAATKKREDISGKDKERLVKELEDRKVVIVQISEAAQSKIRLDYLHKQTQEAVKQLEDQARAEIAAAIKLREDKNVALLEGIRDSAERELAQKIIALQDERDKILENTQLTEQQRLNIYERFEKQIDALMSKPAATANLFDGLATAAQSALSGIGDAIADSFKEMTSAREKARKDANDIAKKETDDLEKQLAIRQITYDEYQQKIAAANRERSKDEQKDETVGSRTLTKIREGLSTSFIKQSAEQLAEFQKNFEASQEKSKVLADSFGALGGIALSQFAAIEAEGGGTWRNMAKAIFATARAAAASFSAMILGKEIFEKGLAGIPIAGILTALIQSALSVAQALTVGFKTGRSPKAGENPNQIMGVVHGGEYVFTAQESARHSTLFDTIKRGGDVSNLFVNTKGNLTVQPNNELGGLRDELRAIKKYVARETFGKQAIAVDVRADAGYEARARKVALSRKMARS